MKIQNIESNTFVNTPIPLNMPRINCTVSKCDENTKYGQHGLNLNEDTEWLSSSPRRLFSEGEIAMGCIDLDGTTVGKDGSWSITHLKRSDFIDGPDCFVDRNVRNPNKVGFGSFCRNIKLSSMQIFAPKKVTHLQVQSSVDSNPAGRLPKTIGSYKNIHL